MHEGEIVHPGRKRVRGGVREDAGDLGGAFDVERGEVRGGRQGALGSAGHQAPLTMSPWTLKVGLPREPKKVRSSQTLSMFFRTSSQLPARVTPRTPCLNSPWSSQAPMTARENSPEMGSAMCRPMTS